ncbi:aminoacyl-tRNA hydrolase [Sulfurimonas autotrophica]|uniref:Peptidyl-tRNA hydrolase n=1 Tax=Sulfurimonas autotrophica (strain ATCC BAA-671 / DSM 16294 / JCM 11897 / OK10) TaxID=563040 RepID=E0UPH0_SULAO|nr:aminoacyl-tRNA hydrolase [Sulfurimonas autotrophica]ADN09700.1 peptidyl-tRNA hydrolase [Sulfurimonas autotrophica DSM 16294]
MLIVGLGNPGSDYENTRHNIGFMVVDELIRRHNAVKLSSSSFQGELYKFQNHFLLKPLTYMNLSGESVIKVKQFYKLEDVVVIHDDLDLSFGALRFKKGGGHGGHNGLKSIDSKISREYIRVRMGIGKPEHKGEIASYVLSPFNQTEQKCLQEWINKSCDAVEFLLTNSLEDTSSKYSQKAMVC